VPAETLRVVKRGFTVEDYHRLGRHCVESYYDAAAPFDEGEILDVERKVLIELDTQGRYRLIGYIDRLSRGADGVLEIHDYKTSGSLPRPRDLETDRQLALYEMGLRSGPGVLLSEEEPARHVWHYLAFGQRFQRTLSREGLRGLARDVRSLIDRVEEAVAAAAASESELPARPGVLCHWCDFSAHCPEGRAEQERRGVPGLPRPSD
jgi:putative RecB family exonuclease